MFTFLRKKALLAILFLMSGIITSFATPSGSGTKSDPYLIGSAEDLVWFRDLVNSPNYTACAKLTEDIDLKDVCHPASEGVEEVSWTPITKTYLGTFDGNGKKIKNLYYNGDGQFGFFKDLCGTIKNLYFVDAYIISTHNEGQCAVVAAYADGATLDNITIEGGSIQGKKYTGACAGYSKKCTFKNCTNKVTVSGSEFEIGGICGHTYNSTIVNCMNLGNITGGAEVGGIAGSVRYDNNSIKDCANYGDIEANNSTYTFCTAGGIVGKLYDGTLELNNVFNTGNIISADSYNGYPGFILGTINYSTVSITGTTVYNNSSTLKMGENVKPAAAVGYGTLTGVLAFDAEMLKTGFLATILQQNATDGTAWGQQIGTDNTPVLGSTYKVYATKNIHITCLGEIQETDATFTNTAPETEGTVTVLHSSTPEHHEAVAATCTTDGNVEYYECAICHHNFSNSDMLHEIASVVTPALGHDYRDCACTRCEEKIEFQTLKEGTTTIQIKAENDERNKIEGYRNNLYKFTAPGDGTLTVYTTGELDTYGTLWGSYPQTSYLTYNDDSEGSNFKFTYEVTKGTVYYIGVRQYSGYKIDDYTITIEGTWPHEMEELTITDKEAMDYSAEYTVTTLTYKRTFYNTNWQPLYVPFAMASADWKDKGLEVACINNFHEYNTAEGKKVVLEVNKVTAGVLHPNTPYLIRATEVGEKTITLNDVTVMTEENTYTCSSMTRNYNFKGIYSEKSDLDAENDYILSGGQLMNMSDDAILSPQRWYVSVENRSSMLDAEETTTKARSIAIEVVGESSATGIEQVGVIEDDAETDAQGIYDLQGRRLSSAPKQGVFIMNGKKYVK